MPAGSTAPADASVAGLVPVPGVGGMKIVCARSGDSAIIVSLPRSAARRTSLSSAAKSPACGNRRAGSRCSAFITAAISAGGRSGQNLAERLRVLADDLHHHGRRRLRLERPVLAEQLVEHDAGRKHVGPAVDLAARHLFGRHVEGAAQHAARAGHRRRGDLGDAEIQQLHGAVVEQPDVGRLDVAVDDALLVRVVQAGEQLRDDVELLHERQRRLRLQPLRRGSARAGTPSRCTACRCPRRTRRS